MTRAHSVQREINRYTPNEALSILVPKRPKVVRPVIYAHAYNGHSTAIEAETEPSLFNGIPETLQARLYGGEFIGNGWGLDASTDAMESLRAAIVASPTWHGSGISTDKVVLYASSMGFQNCCCYARRFPTKVAAIVGIVGVCDAEDIRANNRNGLQSAIETAWTNNATWQAARSTHNPTEFAATALSSIPGLLFYSSDDPVTPTSVITTFAAAWGANLTLYNQGAVGHTGDGVNIPTLLDFIGSYL